MAVCGNEQCDFSVAGEDKSCRIVINPSGETCNRFEGTATSCPECGDVIVVDFTPEYNQEKPWERCCLSCGWFDLARYSTKEGAISAP